MLRWGLALELDILRYDAFDVIEEQTKEKDLGIAVFSAAYCFNGAFLTGTEEEYRRMSELNIFGAYRFADYFGRRF